MGTYTELTVADYPLIASKSNVIPKVMTIFRETDRLVFERKIADRNDLVWGVPEDTCHEEIERAIVYSCETSKVIDRLNIMGFTFHRVKNEFEIGRQLLIERYASWAEESDDSQWFVDEWDFFKKLTFDAYLAAFEVMIQNNLMPTPFDDNEKEGLDPVIKYILGDNEEFLFGFPVNDIRLLIRLACELVDPNTYIVQDITDLVDNEYYSDDEKVCINATRELVAGYPENSSRIILTEGKTDAEILKKSLRLLYPHLYEYYSFFDFNSSKSPGSAGHLVNLVKAFAATGISNYVIALFDNDTAARDAVRALKQIQIPPNITIQHYPQLELLNNYPTTWT